ncbi:hypothetical protein [Sphingopyxis fribergensis]|uniref:hypothetical protein n=1 Tax=Sphingopyxis fribergensis TaxID=1515612 RepID=UPI000A7AF64E|nr:hypothetical protein [Sphingopyxis fribergensis]
MLRPLGVDDRIVAEGTRAAAQAIEKDRIGRVLAADAGALAFFDVRLRQVIRGDVSAAVTRLVPAPKRD